MTDSQGSGMDEFEDSKDETEKIPAIRKETVAQQGEVLDIIPVAEKERVTEQSDAIAVTMAATVPNPTVTPANPITDSGASQRDFLSRLGAGWARFRLWRLRRPFWGSILMLIASLLMLWGPVALLRLALLPGSSVGIGLLVGGLMLMMALLQLFAPAHSVITGAVGIVLSLVSLPTAGFGGFGIGMILGILGSAQGVAWKANARPLPIKRVKASVSRHLSN